MVGDLRLGVGLMIPVGHISVHVLLRAERVRPDLQAKRADQGGVLQVDPVKKEVVWEVYSFLSNIASHPNTPIQPPFTIV